MFNLRQDFFSLRSKGELCESSEIEAVIHADTDSVNQHDNASENRDQNAGAGAILTSPAGHSAFDAAEIHDGSSTNKYDAESDKSPGKYFYFGKDDR